MSRIFPDRFVLLLIATLALAWMLPLDGAALKVAQGVIYVGIFLLFFLHGLRLPRGEVVKAARGLRLQGAMLSFCYIAMPLAGWCIAQLAATALPEALWAGIIYLAVLPSTVQSAISYTAMGGGNVAASVVGAALSNLAGIVLTPLLVAIFIGANGIGFDASVIIKIASLLLLPFALGQMARRLLGDWASKQKAMLSLFDRGVILLAVFIAFSGAVSSGALARLEWPVIIALMLAIFLLLTIAFGGAMLLGGILKLPRGDRISLIFAGAHKSIATGAPMAAILFGADAGLVILPAILYHMAQLIVSAPVAVRLQKSAANRR